MTLALVAGVGAVVGVVAAGLSAGTPGSGGVVGLFALWAASPFVGLAGLAAGAHRRSPRGAAPLLAGGALATVLGAVAVLLWFVDDSSTAPLILVWVPLYQWGLVLLGAVVGLARQLLSRSRRP